MKTTRTAAALVGLATLVWFAPGCSKARREISDRDRKEAALLTSEAQFALNLRDWARAEGLLARTVQLVPKADAWMALGSSRVRLGNKAGAREAYQKALRAFEDDAAVDEKRVEPWLGQITVLALLGKADASRAVVAKAAKRFPLDDRLRSLTDPKQFEAMLNDPGFKESAL